ncbi:MAG: hypothetical protein IJ517_03015 [Alphaproteobacteria bacterium]|nr:hypothetical protein [Alphaproteobacteria bacterium]
MKNRTKIFANKNSTSGSMLVELLLSVALAALIIPYVFRYQQAAVIRAQNIAIANQMTEIQVALERYIIANRPELLRTVGRNITRVSLSDLAEYGVPESVLSQGDEKYQLRILKSADSTGASTLQGVVVRASEDITPLRTREIVNLSGGTMGFVDGTHAYGTFGAWHTDTVDMGVDLDNAIIETTAVNRDSALYLWRVPSNNPDDAKMMSALNLGGHDLVNVKYFNSDYAEFTDGLSVKESVSTDMIFTNRPAISNGFTATSATVAGMLSSDAKNLEVSGQLTLLDLGKMSSLTAKNLWVSNLTLGGLSVSAKDDLALLKINQALDITAGRIDAMFVSVGFTGSMTPRLVVYDRIEDSVNADYYWDASSSRANFVDASFVELNRMATLAMISEGDKSTISGQIFGSVSANKNATVADYMNAIREIQTRVSEKYRLLNLE